MHGTHLVDEDSRAKRLLGRDLLAEYGLALVFAAAEGNHQIRVIVDVKVDGLAWIKVDLPDAHVFVFQHDPLTNLAQGDAARSGFFKSIFVRHAAPTINPG